MFNSLDNGAQVLTAHRRQARQIRYRYAAAKQARNIQAWESPRVSGWDDWLVQLHHDILWSGYDHSSRPSKLLSLFQQRLVWQSVIEGSSTLALDDLAGTARTAMAAWSMMQAYRLPDPAHFVNASRDVEAFVEWKQQYLRRCNERAFLDHARLPDTLAAASQAGTVGLPAHMVLVGFDTLTPQQQHVVDRWVAQGSKVEHYLGPQTAGRVGRLQFDSDTLEYEAAARWVRDILARGESGNTAVLVPRLNDDRRRIERIFDNILAPAASLPGDDGGGRPYNLAVGNTFVQAPIIVAALRVCELIRAVAPFDTVSSLLRSSFLRGGAIEGSLRAHFDVWLREQNIARLPVKSLAPLLARFMERRSGDPGDTIIGPLWERVMEIREAGVTVQRASHWASMFADVLAAAGWPGDGALDSSSFQTAERWRALLEEMSGLDFVTPAMDANQALELLRSLAQSVSFQPQTPDLSVQVLLPEQALGLDFDHLWWCGVHASALPESARPNPFIPRVWQQAHRTPGGGAVVQLERAQRLARGLMRCGGETIVSAPRVVDEHPVAMSPILNDVPLIEAEDLPLAVVERYQDAIAASAQLESLDDIAGPPLAQIEPQQVTPGGSRIFALQASCAFRAFAELRLGAQPLEEPTSGLNARERGSLVHGVLEAVWEQLGGYEALEKLHGGEFLATRVWDLTEQVLDRTDRRRALAMTPRFRALEHQRLRRRVLRWLDIESERAPFDVVRAEKSSLMELGGVTVKITADRVDRLSGGGLAVIDYKTGSASVGEWFGERPVQPQLPMYVLAQSEPVDAVAFGFVRPKQDGFAGIARDGGKLPGVGGWDKSRYSRLYHLEWDDLTDHWRAHLSALGQQFAGGEARVDPKKGACRYCHLASLCRVDAAAMLDDDAEQEAGDE